MSLHAQPLANAPIASRSGIFRLKALFSEQRARESNEPGSKNDWEELAIEWQIWPLARKGKSNEIDDARAAKRAPIRHTLR
jgi:hypothetical protein